MDRVLLIPSDHGGGRGHVARCIYLAKRLMASGKQAALVLEPKHYQTGIDAGVPTYLLNTGRERFFRFQFKKPHIPRVELVNPPEQPPVFMAFHGLAYQVPRDEYLSFRIVKSRFKKLEKIAQKFKPDVLIGDTHFLTYLLGKKLQVPVVQITRLAGFPPQPQFFWWLDQPPEMTPPDALAPFTPLLDELQEDNVKSAEDLLSGDLYLIPSSKAVEPVKKSRNVKVVFSGPLLEISEVNQKIPFFEDQDAIPKIYVTIGGGANRLGLQRLFEAFLQLFDRKDFKVLISTAGLLPAKNFNGRSTNVLFSDWVPGLSAIRKSDLVVHHGGYGSTMEVLMLAKPSIVVPFHSEQEGNGRRLEELQTGALYLPFDGPLQELTFNWPFGQYTMLGGNQLHLEADDFLPLIEQIYDDQIYQRLKKTQEELQNLQQKFDPVEMLKKL